MRHWLIMFALLCVGCMGSLRDDAASATNTAQSVLAAADQVWAPILADEIARAKPLDDAHYQEHMAPYLVVHEVLEEARRATQLLNLALQIWDSQADGGAMFREFAPCLIQDLELLRAVLLQHAAKSPPQIAQALRLVQTGLAAVVPQGATCTRAPKPRENIGQIFRGPEPSPATPVTDAPPPVPAS